MAPVTAASLQRVPLWPVLAGAGVLFIPFALMGGWVVGWISARASERFTTHDGLPPPRPRALLLADPIVQASLALVWAGLAVQYGPSARWLGAALLAVPLVQVGVTDIRYRYVYTAVAVVGLFIGVLGQPTLLGASWWVSPLAAAIAYLVFLAIWGVGRLLYRGVEPLATGDITIAAMVGAITGAKAATALVAGILLSGAIAVVLLLVVRSGKAMMPYGPGLCLGGLLALFLG